MKKLMILYFFVPLLLAESVKKENIFIRELRKSKAQAQNEFPVEPSLNTWTRVKIGDIDYGVWPEIKDPNYDGFRLRFLLPKPKSLYRHGIRETEPADETKHQKFWTFLKIPDIFLVFWVSVVAFLCVLLCRNKKRKSSTVFLDRSKLIPKYNYQENVDKLKRLKDNETFIEKVKIGVIQHSMVKVNVGTVKYLKDELSKYLEKISEVLNNHKENYKFPSFVDNFFVLNEKLSYYCEFLTSMPNCFALLSSCRYEVRIKIKKAEDVLNDLYTELKSTKVEKTDIMKKNTELFSKPEQTETTLKLLKLLSDLKRFLEKLQKDLHGDTITKIKFEKCLHLDDEFKKFWSSMNKVPEIFEKLSRLRVEINEKKKDLEKNFENRTTSSSRYEPQKGPKPIDLMSNFSANECFIEKLQNGFDASSRTRINHEEISKLIYNLSKFYTSFETMPSFDILLDEVPSFGVFVENFVNYKNELLGILIELEQITPDYKELSVRFYSHVNPKKGDLKQALRVLEKDIRNKFTGTEKKSTEKPGKDEILQKTNEQAHSTIKDLLFKLSAFKYFIETIPDDFEGYTLIHFNIEKSLQLDEELLKFWKSQEKHPNIYTALSHLQNEIRRKISRIEQNRQKKYSTSDSFLLGSRKSKLYNGNLNIEI